MIDNNKDDSFDHLIYIRVYEGCNLYCKHCFIPANPKKLSLDTLKNSCEKIRNFATKGQVLLFQWHGGEPTARGVNFIREALEIINSELGDDFSIKHSMQTNLMNYNEKWTEIYRKYFDSKIGISWDAKIRLLKKNDDESNKEYEKKFWENVHKLHKDNIEPYLVITGTRNFFDHFKHASEFFNLLQKNKITKVHIERLTKTGNAIDNWSEIGLSYKEYSLRMAKILKLYVGIKNSKINLSISPFDGYLSSVESLSDIKPKGYGCNSGKCDTAFHTIDSDGYKAGCTALTTNEQSTNGVVEFNGLRARRDEKTRHCFGCKYKPICNSGCATEVTNDGSGECSGGFLLYEAADKIITRKLVI